MKTPSQRRIGLLFAAVATLGWALALAFAWVNASLRREHESALRQAVAVQQELRAALETERRASGGLAETERRLAEGQAGMAKAAAERDRAAAELQELRAKAASARSDLAALRDGQARAERLLADLASRQTEAEQQSNVARAALSAVQDAIGIRTRELAEARRNLEAAQQDFSAARQGAAEAERWAAATRSQIDEMAARKADLERTLTTLDEQARAGQAALTELDARLAAVRRELSELHSRLADRRAASADEPAGPGQR
jgi:chromosome segregation ATPase